MIKINCKNGQVSIFVIIGLIIVASIILFFLISQRDTEIEGQISTDNPEAFIDNCVRDSLRDKVDIMIPQGGFVNPRDTKLFNDIEVAYLCKNVNYYEPCIPQYPRYITAVQEELSDEIQKEVENCFITLEEDLESKNYDVLGGEVNISIVLKPGFIETKVERDFSISKEDTTRNFDSFKILLPSSLYDLAFTANEIVSQESRFCYFEYVGFNLLYNDFDVRKTALSDSAKIYSILYKSTGEEMNIAVRGCAIPPGF